MHPEDVWGASQFLVTAVCDTVSCYEPAMSVCAMMTACFQLSLSQSLRA